MKTPHSCMTGAWILMTSKSIQWLATVAPASPPALAATTAQTAAPATTAPAPAPAVIPATVPSLAQKPTATRVTCELCGQKDVDKKSIRAHERSAKCKKLAQLGVVPAAKRPAPPLSPEQPKRQRPTAASSSTPPQARPNRGKRPKGQ